MFSQLPKCRVKELTKMHYYMIQPFFTPDGHSIDISMGEEAVSNIVESAYWAIQAEVEVYDKMFRKNHDDFLIFRKVNSLEKAADILEHYEIQFKTNIVEKTSRNEADYQSEKNYYKLLVPGQPNVDGADNTSLDNYEQDQH